MTHTCILVLEHTHYMHAHTYAHTRAHTHTTLHHTHILHAYTLYVVYTIKHSAAQIAQTTFSKFLAEYAYNFSIGFVALSG